MELLIPAYTLIVTALVLAELRDARIMQMTFKPLAAIGFCLLAIHMGALQSLYGHLILLALAFCAVGDIALLSRTRPKLFQIGMATFGIGHVIYAVAFFKIGFHLTTAVIALAIMGSIAFFLLRYLKTHMEPDMQGPVSVYIVIITTMVVTAAASQNMYILLPAVMFAASDMVVARDRFVSRNRRHALLISPLYFGAQALFAFSVLTV